MEPDEYAEWICSPRKEWGGIPELKILSQHYNSQISVLDIGEDKIIDFKGTEPEKANYSTVIYVVFDGSHYNLGVQKVGEDQFKKIFQKSEIGDIEPQIKELGRLLKKSG